MNKTTPDTDTTTTAPGAGRRISDGALWASAAVIAALIMVMGARVNDTPAHAAMALKTGAYTMVTAEAGDAEALVVVDDREERLLIYMAQAGDKFELRASQDLGDLFAGARASAGP